MSQEIQASLQYFDKLWSEWREKKLEDMKRRSNPSRALREKERENRKKKMMENIESGMADIAKILEEMLPQIQNDYREHKKSDEKIESLIVKETHEEESEKVVDEIPKEDCKKENEEVHPKEQNSPSLEIDLQEKNVGKFWPTITLVPSSKLVCVVKCWNSPNIFQTTDLSSLSYEGNQVDEEEFSQHVENNHEILNAYVQDSQEEKFLHNSLPFYAGFDLRTNPLEEGENDEIKNSLSM